METEDAGKGGGYHMNRRDMGSNTTNGEEGCRDETAEK